jgi:hypothetical protein
MSKPLLIFIYVCHNLLNAVLHDIHSGIRKGNKFLSINPLACLKAKLIMLDNVTDRLLCSLVVRVPSY